MEKSSLTLPVVRSLYVKKGAASTSFYIDMTMPDVEPVMAHSEYGAPESLGILYEITRGDGTGIQIDVSLRLYNKTSTRLEPIRDFKSFPLI